MDSTPSNLHDGNGAVESGENNTGEIQQPKTATQRNDRIHPLTIVALLLCIVWQSSLLPLISAKLHPAPRFHPATVSRDEEPSSDLIQGIVTIDSEAKAYYCQKAVPDTADDQELFSGDKKQKDTRKEALSDAERSLSKYPTQPSLARRVILLRAEIGTEDPLQTWTGVKGYKVYSPIDAFKPDPGASKQMSQVIVSEGAAYALLFSPTRQLNAGQVAQVKAYFAAGPDRKWWVDVANHQIDLRAHYNVAAAHDLAKMEQDAVNSVAALSVVTLGVFAVGLAGLGMLIYILVCYFTGSQSQGLVSDSIRPVLTNEQRRLGIGDLSNLFLIYLLSMIFTEGLSSEFGGQLRKLFLGLSWRNIVTADIGLTTLVTVLGGAITVACAFALAKRRGAKLSYEIGLNFGWEGFWKTFFFGLLGWGGALALLIPIEGLATKIFRDAPSPANPVIPLMMSTPAGFAAVLMYILVAVVAPITEEIVFRGFFLTAMKMKYGVPRGILFTGLAFGLMHPVGIAEQAGLITLGCALAWIANRKQSLLPSMIAHSLQNSFTYCALLISMITIHAPHFS